jgi:copper transport protein
MDWFALHKQWRSSARVVLATALALLALAAGAPAAFAHPSLVRSDPSDAAMVGAPPRAVRLWFSEPISARFSTARLLDVTGTEIPLARPSTDLAAQRQLDLELPNDLAAGVYNVDWKVLSDADGHVTQGHVVFGVGQAVDPPAVLAASDAPVFPSEVVLRWINLLSLTSVVGGLAIAELVLARAARRLRSSPELSRRLLVARRRALLWTIASAAVALLVGVGLFIWQSATLGDGVRANVPTLDVGWQLVSQTRWGTLWLARQAVLGGLLLAAYMLARRTTVDAPLASTSRLVAASTALLCLALMAVQALAGHASSLGAGSAIAVAVDALHLLAASVWMGGLGAMIVALLPWLRPGDSGFVAVLAGARAFGRVAVLSVGVLVPTGLYASSRQVTTVDGLLTSFYGEALVAKVLLVLVVGAMGLVNLALLNSWRPQLFSRRRHRPAPRWAQLSPRRLLVLMLAEAGGGLLVLLATSALTSAVPANGPEYSPPPPPQPTTASQSVKDLLINLEVKPNTAGQNVILVRATSTRRPRPSPVSGVAMRFQYQGPDQSPADQDSPSIKMERLDPAAYRLGGDYLTRPGPWRIEVDVHRMGSEHDVATFAWNVGAPVPEPRPVVFSSQPLGSFLNVAAVVSAILALVLAGALLRRQPQTERRRRAMGRRGTLLVEFAHRE